MTNPSSVYWIHLEEHTDITSQGYVGVSSREPSARYKEHLSVASQGSSTILSKAIHKHGSNLIVTTLLKGSSEYCYFMEERLRPQDHIGWNIVRGGGNPPTFTKGHTAEAKARIGEGAKRTSQSPAHKAARLAKTGVKRKPETIAKMKIGMANRLPWETSRANKQLWILADEILKISLQNQKFGHIKLEKYFGFSKYSLKAMLEKFKKQNWNPIEDAEWVSWVQNQQILKEIVL